MAKFGVQKRRLFIDALRMTCSVSVAAARVGVSRQAAYLHREKDPVFSKAWDDAIESAVDQLVAVAYSRAAKKSDELIKFLLAAHRPEVYGRRDRVEVSGTGGGPIGNVSRIELVAPGQESVSADVGCEGGKTDENED